LEHDKSTGGKVKRLSSVTAVVVVALVAAACSSRGSSTKTTTSAAETSSTTAAAAPGDFGDLKAVCGPGNASGATDKGVTDTSINMATMSDPGNTAVPGLNQELFDSADAFVGWCNAAGGILGRKLVLHKRDAALTNVAAKMIESCQQPDFMLVGNGEALDATGVQQRLSCGLPEIAAYDVSAAAGRAALSLQPLLTPDNSSNLGGALRALKAFDPAATKAYGELSTTYQSVRDSGLRDKAAAAALGYTQVYYEESPIQVNNWRPYAQNVASHHVQVLGFQVNPDYDAALFKSFSDIGYFPKYVVLNTNNYDPKLIADAGALLGQFTGGVYINSFLYPFELASQYPAVQQYISLLQQYVTGAKPKALGVNAFSAWLLWAEAAKACGSNLTRACVMQHAAATTNWTGGGLHTTVDPGNGNAKGSHCFVLLKATPSGFVVDKDITKPNSGIFNCDPANSFTLLGF
jgi:ABC-type branched-subunit amino acid transport system substrate-binding protein